MAQNFNWNFGNPPAGISRTLLVGLRKYGSPAVRFRALDVPAFGSRNLNRALAKLVLDTTPNKNIVKAKVKKAVIHWAPNSNLIGVPMTTDLNEEWWDSDRRFDAPEAVYRLLKLAAERGVGDVLMVNYSIG